MPKQSKIFPGFKLDPSVRIAESTITGGRTTPFLRPPSRPWLGSKINGARRTTPLEDRLSRIKGGRSRLVLKAARLVDRRDVDHRPRRSRDKVLRAVALDDDDLETRPALHGAPGATTP
jgi:hypothetical protein